MIRLINAIDKLIYLAVIGSLRLAIGLIGFIALLIFGAITM